MTRGETEAWESGRLTQSLTHLWSRACLGGWGLLASRTCPLLSPAWAWKEGIKAQGLFDPSLGREQVCSCPRCAARRRCAGGDAPTLQRGTLRWPGHGTSSGRAQAGSERSFLHFTDSPSLEGAVAQGAKGNSNQNANISCGAAAPTAGNRAPRPDEATDPTSQRTQIPFTRQRRANNAPCRGRRPTTPKAPEPAAWSPGKLRLGLWEGPTSKPRGRAAEVRLQLWFPAEKKRRRQRREGGLSERGPENWEPPQLQGSQGFHLWGSLPKASWIRQGKSRKDLFWQRRQVTRPAPQTSGLAPLPYPRGLRNPGIRLPGV